MKVFKFHIPKGKLSIYLDSACIKCGRKRRELNKFVSFQGVELLGGMNVIDVDGKLQPVCDDCLHQKIKFSPQFI